MSSSWRPGCPVALGDLRVLTVAYWGFDGASHDGRLVVLAGPFTPDFGSDGLSRVQQFMSAVAAAVDRG